MILPPETSRHVACWGTVIDDDPGSIGWILPRVVSGFDGDIAAISSFGPHDCALTTDGAARCWGPNRYGQLGDGTTEVRAAATAVSGLAAGVAQIAVGRFHTCALLTKGQLKCWGANFAGQLGDGTTEERHAPVLIDAGGLVRAVAAGSSISCALIDDGSVRCWGDWLTKVPVTVDLGGEIATAIAAGNDHACALMADGGLKCWGRNRVGQVGDGTQIDRTAAVDVVGLEGGVESVAAAGTRTCAIRSDGGVMCWGAEETYSTPQARLLPEPIIGLEGRALAVVVADRHVCVLGQEAEGATPVVQCWGDNASGELGVNNGWLPVDVTVPDAFSFLRYSSKQ
jgi:alpha-tubulin suppressor-like RCC1 family protein